MRAFSYAIMNYYWYQAYIGKYMCSGLSVVISHTHTHSLTLTLSLSLSLSLSLIIFILR